MAGTQLSEVGAKDMTGYFHKEKSDPRCTTVMIAEAYQLLPALLMGMSPIVFDTSARQADEWRPIAEHFGYSAEWKYVGNPCPCPADLVEVALYKVK
jgi:hypothetical protein